MRFHLTLSAAAALILGGCLAQPTDKGSETARATISSAPAAMAPACPPAPACAPATSAVTSGPRHGARVHRANHRPAARTPASRTVRIYSSHGADPHADLAGGPRAYAPDGPADVRYRYGALPPVGGWSDAERRAYENRAYDDPRNAELGAGPRGYRGRTYDDRDRATDRWRDERWERPEDGAGYYHRREDSGRDSSREGAPPPSGSGSRTTERSSSQWRGGGHRGDSVYDYDARREAERSTTQSRGTQGDSGWRRWEGRSSESATSSYSERQTSGDPGCCAPASRVGAAGFDRNGFLTWPGKVPARP